MNRRVSILQQERAAGYREGFAAAHQCLYDDAYQYGADDARKDSPSRMMWLCIGIFTGMALASLAVIYG